MSRWKVGLSTTVYREVEVEIDDDDLRDEPHAEYMAAFRKGQIVGGVPKDRHWHIYGDTATPVMLHKENDQ